MAFEETLRWFGPQDPVSLKEVRQTGASGVVTALHQIPIGGIWPVDEILKRKQLIEAEGLKWSVAESIPVHENIKKRKDNYRHLIDNYKISITNLSKCGIDTVCYNFMPVLDWSRTDLKVMFRDGSITTKFEARAFAAFDLFILKRHDAEKNYSKIQIEKAKEYFESINETQKEKLIQTILLGLPGSLEAYTIEEFRKTISEYNNISDKELRNNLYSFIKEIIPAAEESGVFMAIHPDDPPFPLLGLPRIVSSKKDLEQIVNAVDSPSNGITFCSGSFGAGYQNNLTEIVETFASKINFLHLRNVIRNVDGDFMEENHLEGDVDIYSIIKTMIIEQQKRFEKGEKNSRLPMRPDHGHLMLPDQNKEGIYPGYSLFGRMRGLAEIRGMETAIIRSLNLKF
jgi:mannonate dehydratase